MRGRGWILIVEDDPGVASVIIELLEERAFECHWAKSDLEARNALVSRPAPAALVLDVNLGPGTTGFDVARFGRQRHPRVPVIYTSGAVTEGSFKVFGVPESRFLPKPFSYEEFDRALRLALFGRSTSGGRGGPKSWH